MAKIFDFVPNRGSKTNKTETDTPKVSHLSPQNEKQKTDETTKSATPDKSKEKVKDPKLALLTGEQFINLLKLKMHMLSLKGGYSQSAYNGYYQELDKSPLADLVPILENLSIENFTSRPAYAWALINILEKKMYSIKP